MKIDFVLSDLTKSATTQCLKDVVFSAEQNKFENHYVIVPETKSIIIERELLTLSSVGAFDNVFVYSFVRLLSKLSKLDESKILKKQSAILILRKIISENQKNFVCYKRAAKMTGFAEKIYETIQQFKSSNIVPEDILHGLKIAQGALKSKLTDLALIFRTYEGVISEKFYDDCDKLRILSTLAKTSEEIKNSRFYIVGFDSITPEMAKVIKDISANAKSITFSCCYFNDQKPNKIIQHNELFKKFAKLSDELKYPYTPKYLQSTKSGDFKIIRDNLFAYSGEKFVANGNVNIYEAPNVRGEIDFVANKILEEVESGKKFNEIGILVCNFDDYLTKIKDCFKSYDIPFFINERHSLSDHFFVDFIKTVVSFYQSNLQAEDVIKFCSSVFFGLSGISKFVNFVNEKGINYSKFLKTISDDEEVNDILKFVREHYVLLKEKLQSCRKVGEFLNILCDFIEKFNVKTKLEQIAEQEREDGFEVESEITKAIFSKFEEFNLTLRVFLGDAETNLKEFMQIYLSGFESIKLNLSPLSIDSVIIQDNTDGFYDIRDMFILGASEGNFPKKLQNTGIILDEELVQTTRLVGKEIEPLIQEINDREQFKAFESLLEPSEKLFLCYPQKDQGGMTCKPSSIIFEIDEMFDKKARVTAYKNHIFASQKGFEFRFSKHINQALNGQADITELDKEYSVLGDKISPALSLKINEMTSPIEFKKIVQASKLYFSNDITSVTQLQTYFLCPYQFFVNYGLRLKENKQAKLSSIDVGVIIHKIAELFVESLPKMSGATEQKKNLMIQKCIDIALQILQVNLESNKAIVGLIKREATALCDYLFIEQHSSNFKVIKNEYEFKGVNAIKIPISKDKTILLEGKIDRIDKFKNFIRIIDYKTGSINKELSAMYYGKNIQLITYLSAIGDQKDLQVAGIFYFPVHANFVKDEKDGENFYQMQGFVLDDIDIIKNMDKTLGEGNLNSKFFHAKIKSTDDGMEIADLSTKNYLSSKEFEMLSNYNQKLCLTAIKEILSGNIEPSPLKQKSAKLDCGSCKLCGFCGIEHAKFANGRELKQKVEIQSFDCKEGE